MIFNRAAIPDDPNVRLDAFVNFCNATVAAAPDTRRAMSTILDFIVRATEAVGATIALPERDALVVSCSTAGSAHAPGERLAASSLAARVFAERKTYLANSTLDPRTDPSRSYARIGTTVMAPIMQGRRTYGVLLVKYPAAYGIHAKEAQAVSEFAGICGTILGSAMYLEQKVDPRAADPVTGLGNRRAYERDLAMQLDLYRRFGVPLSVALFSPAQTGDGVAVQWTSALRARVRASDAVFRIADGLFAAILKNCGEQQAVAARTRIAQRLPECSAYAVASPRSDEGLRRFQIRLESALSGQAEAASPTRTIWERFTKGAV
jgi:GGDEF domain-containing protein